MIGRSALVIDDSKSARFALRRYLEGHRYHVEAVETADEAMRVLETSRPGVIFLDHVMPGVDGFTVLKSIRSNAATAQIPVVICSSNEGPEFNAQARVAGANCVLQKPPNPEQLYRILDQLERVPETPTSVTPAASSDEARFAVAAGRPLSSVPQIGSAIATPSSGSAMAATGEDALREQLEVRLKKVSHGLFVQFAEIKATVAHLASQQAKLAEGPNALRTDLRNGLEETHQALRLVTSRIEGIEREMFSQLTAMRTHVDNTLKAHADRVADIAQVARQAAAEEAQVVAERTVMSAALRISDQLADAILGAVGRR
ncbi:MAG: response regulator [Panacagrimonas sp.]|jgi:CheY-like chemotaxis protein|nr:response regulator [Panacagrimonas sp.]